MKSWYSIRSIRISKRLPELCLKQLSEEQSPGRYEPDCQMTGRLYTYEKDTMRNIGARLRYDNPEPDRDKLSEELLEGILKGRCL